MTDFMRTLLSPPYTVSRGNEWQALGAGSKTAGNYGSKIAGADDAQAQSPQDSCQTSVDSQWGTHGIFRKKPFHLVSVQDKDAKPNLETTLTKDDQGQGTLHVKNSDGAFSSVVDIPVGDVSKADARFFQPGAFAGSGQVDVAQDGSQSGLRFDQKQAYDLKNGGIFLES